MNIVGWARWILMANLAGWPFWAASAGGLTAAEPLIRVACVGDSITYGYGISEREQKSYPAQLARLLGTNYDVRNFGKSGAAVLKQSHRPYGTQPEFKSACDFAPDIVVLMLGTNDTQAVNWQAHAQDFAKDFEALIATFRELESKPTVLICLPPPLIRDRGNKWDTDAILRKEIIPQLEQVAAAGNVPVIDFYTAFAEQGELLPDGVHPNANGATVLAEHISRAIKKLPARASARHASSSP